MSVSLLFVLMSWISVMPCPTQAQDGGRELYFPAHYFFAWKRLVNHKIISVSVQNLDECEYRCYLNANCVSLNIRDHLNGTHDCELNNSTHLEHDRHLKDSKLSYYRGAENKCGENERKCKNNSTCRSGFTQKGYRCLCRTGFEGDHCKNDINECESGSHSCHSNAACNNTEGGYNCSCKEGYTGDGQNCTDIDDCISHPCKNNGTCTDRVNGFNCSCTPGFSGTQCEIDIDDCASHPCKNGGTCVDQLNGFHCSCAPGFNGTQCETDIDDCTSHPCKNNGTCTDRVNGFNCSCAPGFNGTQCERDIDECTAQVNPCDDANNLECKNTRGSYNCQCKDGFVKNGDDCEVVCPQYKNLTDADRKYGPDTTGSPKCDDQLHGWYRFHGDAGRKMMTTCPSVNKCGGSLSAWLNGDHPTVAQGSVKKKVCFRMAEPGDCCVESYFTDVKNCGSYFIYKLLPNTVTCYYRYCGTD